MGDTARALKQMAKLKATSSERSAFLRMAADRVDKLEAELETYRQKDKGGQWFDAIQMAKIAIAMEKLKEYEQQIKDGTLSDGYHTFNELYHHRAVLFSVICNMFPDKAWKSKKHSDGTMYDGMFIVGIKTPQGQATYHYDIDPYWTMFDVPELAIAPEWDGHTPDDAINRVAALKGR